MVVTGEGRTENNERLYRPFFHSHCTLKRVKEHAGRREAISHSAKWLMSVNCIWVICSIIFQGLEVRILRFREFAYVRAVAKKNLAYSLFPYGVRLNGSLPAFSHIPFVNLYTYTSL